MLKAVRVTTVETRAKAARVLDLQVVERVAKPEKRKKNKTWSPTWKGSTQIGQFPMSVSATTLDSNAWREEF